MISAVRTMKVLGEFEGGERFHYQRGDGERKRRKRKRPRPQR